MLTTQVPTTIEIVTNNETMWVREIKMKNRSIILKKSRIPIIKENVDVYTILELFTNIDTNQYNIPYILKQILEKNIYYNDYNEVTRKILFDETSITIINKIIESGVFEI